MVREALPRHRHSRTPWPRACWSAPATASAPRWTSGRTRPTTTSSCWCPTLTPIPAPARSGPITSSASAPRRSRLARAVIRQPVDRALDVGTGCGIQALHLAGHAEIGGRHRRQPAGAGAGRRDRPAERPAVGPAGRSTVRAGRGEDFDLIVCNPPFVISERRDAVLLPGFRAGRRRDLPVAGRPASAGPPATGRHRRNCWPTGSSARTPTGANGSASGSPRPAVTRGWCSARLADPAEYVGLWLDRRRRGRQVRRIRSRAPPPRSPRTGWTTSPPNACRASGWG